MSKTQILIVEDDRIVAEGIQHSLHNFGYGVAAIVSSGTEAINTIKDKKPDLVMMDIVLKGRMDGIEAAERIRAHLDIPVVYLTAYADEKVLERAKMTEPFGYIIKPFEDRELHTVIEMALYKHKLEKKLKENEKKYRLLIDGGIIRLRNPPECSVLIWPGFDLSQRHQPGLGIAAGNDFYCTINCCEWRSKFMANRRDKIFFHAVY